MSIPTSRTLPLATGGPADLLDGYSAGGLAWLHDGAGLAGQGVAASIVVRLDEAAEAATELLAGFDVDDPLGLPGTGPVAFAAFPFDPKQPGTLTVPARLTGANRQGQLWVTEVASGRSGLVPRSSGRSGLVPRSSGRSGLVPRSSGRSGLASRSGNPQAEPSRFIVGGYRARPEWVAMITDALDRIAAGTLEKVVLARQVRVEANAEFDLPSVIDRLRHDHPSSFVYAIGGFLGASPELLVRRRGALVVSRPMAGTVERGDTIDDDQRALDAMASSAKQLTEHRLVVEAVRAALEPWCDEVSASARPEVARLATLAHLATTVAGRLAGNPPLSALAVAALLHPTPAVGGVPRPSALAAIAELEGFDRGCYAGPVGWVDARGDGDWAVAVRCAQVNGSTATLVAGAGIVAGSDPAAEWSETQAKLEPMLRALVRV